MVGSEEDHTMVLPRFAAAKLDANGEFLWEWKVMSVPLVSMAQIRERWLLRAAASVGLAFETTLELYSPSFVDNSIRHEYV